MKKIFFILRLIFAITLLQAQDYLISFEGTGATTTVDSVKVENLTNGTSLSLKGMDTLFLKLGTSAINNVGEPANERLHIYPNPMKDYCFMEFIAEVSSEVTIEIFDLSGRKILYTCNTLPQGNHTYQIYGLNSGTYIVHVTSDQYSHVGKIISNKRRTVNAGILHQNHKSLVITNMQRKSTKAQVQMPYNQGDMLKFTAKSGEYITIMMKVPNSSEKYTFDFFECKDGDNNKYPVVRINGQVWMAENLKTTSYNDGTPIPLVTDTTAWSGLTTPAYCWYDNDTNNKYLYGGLYNCYVVKDTIEVCPSGWHMPTINEWETLVYFVGEEVAGQKLRTTGTIEGGDGLWVAPNEGATNETGFSALPAGSRHIYGAFWSIGENGRWWSCSDDDFSLPWGFMLYTDMRGAGWWGYDMQYGFSIRCITY